MDSTTVSVRNSQHDLYTVVMADSMDARIEGSYAMQHSINPVPWRSLKLDGTATGSRCARGWLPDIKKAKLIRPLNISTFGFIQMSGRGRINGL